MVINSELFLNQLDNCNTLNCWDSAIMSLTFCLTL